MYISLYDLGLFIMFTIFVIASIYLIVVLHRTLCVVGYVREILHTHDDDIRQTISVLPEAIENINDLAISLKETVDQTQNAFGSLQTNVTDTVDDLREGLENVTFYAKIIGEVWRAVFSKSA